MEEKITSNHIIVLKCIIEEAKKQRRPIFACFIDIKKAFDSIWRQGLFYELLYDYGISYEFVNTISVTFHDIQVSAGMFYY